MIAAVLAAAVLCAVGIRWACRMDAEELHTLHLSHCPDCEEI